MNCLSPRTTQLAMGIVSRFGTLVPQIVCIAQPEETAAIIHFLASDNTTYANGETIYSMVLLIQIPNKISQRVVKEGLNRIGDQLTVDVSIE